MSVIKQNIQQQTKTNWGLIVLIFVLSGLGAVGIRYYRRRPHIQVMNIDLDEKSFQWDAWYHFFTNKKGQWKVEDGPKTLLYGAYRVEITTPIQMKERTEVYLTTYNGSGKIVGQVKVTMEQYAAYASYL